MYVGIEGLKVQDLDILQYHSFQVIKYLGSRRVSNIKPMNP